MVTSITTETLPPLILHPFADQGGPSKLVKSSRASLMIQGLLPSGEASADDLDRTLLDGRYCEVRMLYYVGKDLMRWLEQCREAVVRDESSQCQGLHLQSFATFLIENPPESVREKLQKWGVADYKAIFARALGLNVLFADAPERNSLSPEFIRFYYRYADALYQTWQQGTEHEAIQTGQFDFQLYASGEYSRLLERKWLES